MTSDTAAPSLGATHESSIVGLYPLSKSARLNLHSRDLLVVELRRGEADGDGALAHACGSAKDDILSTRSKLTAAADHDELEFARMSRSGSHVVIYSERDERDE